LLWKTIGSALQPDPRLEEMVRWAEKIDSAGYDSVEEAFSNAHPALVVYRSLTIEADQQYCEFLIGTLKKRSLEEVSRRPEVQRRFLRAQERSTLGLERVRQSIRMEGTVAVCEASSDGVLMNRYSPYYFYPQARYSIAITHSRYGSKITAMRNPWLNFESINLGQFMRQFGGGGHQRVGSLILPPEREGETEKVVSQLLQAVSLSEQPK
jgi:hypothetical protein